MFSSAKEGSIPEIFEKHFRICMDMLYLKYVEELSGNSKKSRKSKCFEDYVLVCWTMARKTEVTKADLGMVSFVEI